MGYSQTKRNRLQVVECDRKLQSSRTPFRWVWVLLALIFIVVVVGLVLLVRYLLRVPDEEPIELPKMAATQFVHHEIKPKPSRPKRVWQFEYPYDLGEIFFEKNNWRMSKKSFIEAFHRVHVETNEACSKDVYIFDLNGLRFFRENVQEVRVRFTPMERSIARVEIVLYGRGNCLWEMPWFEMKRIWDRVLDLREDAEDKVEFSFRDYENDGHVDISRWFGEFPFMECWFGYKPVCIDKEWRQNPEFISVSLSRDPVVRFRRKDHSCMVVRVHRDYKAFHNGDVYVSSVPMVNQGRKGYCSVATMERIMRYYGMDVGMHEFAMLAKSDREKGTSPVEMKRALDLVCKTNGMTWTQHVKDDRIDVALAMAYKNSEAVMRLRLEDVNGYSLFTNRVIESINRGLPVYWSVCDLFPTADDYLREDHTRLILGYNSSSAELIFSDTWGASHEFKRKGVTNAWVMTKSALTVDPSLRKDVLDGECPGRDKLND